MSNPKDDDIINTADDQPETLIDDQLDNVDGGLGYQLKNVMVTSYSIGGANADTVYGGGISDTIYGHAGGDALDTTQLFGGVAALRKRPGRTKY